MRTTRLVLPLVLALVLATAACGSSVSRVDVSRVDYGGVGTVDAKAGITVPIGAALAIQARPINGNGKAVDDVSPTAVADDPKLVAVYPGSNSPREFVVVGSAAGKTVLRLRADDAEMDLAVDVQATP